MSDNVLAVGLFWRNDLGCASVVPSEQTSSSYIILDWTPCSLSNDKPKQLVFLSAFCFLINIGNHEGGVRRVKENVYIRSCSHSFSFLFFGARQSQIIAPSLRPSLLSASKLSAILLYHAFVCINLYQISANSNKHTTQFTIRLTSLAFHVENLTTK